MSGTNACTGNCLATIADGYVSINEILSHAGARDGTTGTDANTTGASKDTAIQYGFIKSKWHISRAFYVFNTSGIT